MGRPLSPLYSLLMFLRSTFYQKGLFKQHKLEIPVISVGNLVLGGTGKTPLVHYIAKHLQQFNWKPAILSRGYKGSATSAINVVSDNTNILLDASIAGDEPRLLAEKLPGIPVINGKQRYITGRFAIDSFASDSLILDDGFQHMGLKRDLNLVLFSAQKLLGNGRVLPGGPLREPLTALKRADAFIIIGGDMTSESNAAELNRFLKESHPEKPLYRGSYKPEQVLPGIFNGINESISLQDACKMEVYGFCGIAGPESFKESLLKNKFNLTGFQSFNDHQDYSTDMITSLISVARSSGAKALITTEKDLVKLHAIFPKDFNLLALPIILQMDEDFEQFLTDHLKILRKP